MMVIDDVVANDPDAHSQSSDLTAVFRNSMSGHDPKDQLLVHMLGQKYFGFYVGF
jgi:hypothetical protein